MAGQDAAASAQLQAFLEREQQVAQVQQMISVLTDVWAAWAAWAVASERAVGQEAVLLWAHVAGLGGEVAVGLRAAAGCSAAS